MFSSLPNDKIFNWTELKTFADDNLALYSIDTVLILTHQLQTAFENIVEKEEIARNERFLLFPQCFLLHQKIVSPFVNIYDIISLFAAESEKLACEVKG